MKALLSFHALFLREWLRFYRQRGRLVGTLLPPILLWLFLGIGLGAAFPAMPTPGGKGYLEYFYPGIVVLSVLFTSIFSNISLIEDRNEGFLQSAIISPVPRSLLVAGKIAGGTAVALLQGTLLLVLAPWAGFPLNLVTVVSCLASVLAIALSLSALGFIFAWRLDSVQGFHAVMNVVLMPMWLLSGAFFPQEKVPAWLGFLMQLNPLAYGLQSLQHALYGKGLGLDFMIHGALGLVFFALATTLAGRAKEVAVP